MSTITWAKLFKQLVIHFARRRAMAGSRKGNREEGAANDSEAIESLELVNSTAALEPSQVTVLTIAIDVYPEQDGTRSKELKGCANDANDFERCIRQIYPHATISGLRNDEATVGGVTRALLSLARAQVQRGSTIIIYYAGHGCIALPPVDYPGIRNTRKQIQGLVLYDMQTSADGTTVKNGFSDVAFGQILQHIAIEKGGNITVILDCCHAGSGTRGSFNDGPASSTLEVGRTRQFNSSSRARFDTAAMHSDSLPRLSDVNKKKNFTSHVLMAGCRKDELARERPDERGAFTGALIEVLQSEGYMGATYKQVIKALTRCEDLKRYKQHPRCEGKSQNRPMFDI